jgi:MFS family permease
LSYPADSLGDVRRDLSILRQRRFALLFAARTASVLGSAFGPVALAFGVLGLPGATATTLSLVTAAEALAMVTFMLLGGVIADRFPRSRVMVVADVGAAVAWGGLAAMLLTGWAPMWLLVATSAFAGMATALFFPAASGVVPEVVAEERLQAANGLLRVGMNLARIVGFAVAGAAVAAFGAGWAMALNAALLLLSAGLTASLRVPSSAVSRSGAERGNVLHDLREGWREYRSRQWLWVVTLQYSLVMMVFQAVWAVLGPVVANDHLGGARGWSLVLAAESVGMLVGVVVAIRARPRHPIRLVVILTFPLAIVPLALGLGAPLLVAIAASFASGVALDVLIVMWDTTMQREIPKEALSRVSSYDALGSLMFGPVGLVLAGPAVDLIGSSRALLISAAVTALASAGALCSPGVRNLTWTPLAEPTSPTTTGAATASPSVLPPTTAPTIAAPPADEPLAVVR